MLVFHVGVILFSEGKYKLWHGKELLRCLESRCQCVGQQFLLERAAKVRMNCTKEMQWAQGSSGSILEPRGH